MSSKSPINRIFELLKGRKKGVLFLVVLVVFSAGFDITVPIISQRLIDGLIIFLKSGTGSFATIIVLSSLGILVATVLSRVLRSAYDFNLFKLATGLEDILRKQVFEKYLRLHALFHHHSSSGQLIGRIERGSISVYTIIHDIFGQNFLPPIIIFAGVLTTLMLKNPLIALTVFLPLPIYIASITSLTKRIYEIEKKANDEFEATAKHAYDVAANVLTVKKFSEEAPEAEGYRKLQARARKTQYSAERLWTILENIQTLVATLGRVAVIVLAGYLALEGKSTVGEFVLYITLQNMAYSPLAQLSIIFPRFRRNMARAERLFNVLDEPMHVADKPDAGELPPFKEIIEFRNVWFRYHEGGRWSVKELKVLIPAKATVALVGRSGSGKTTFVNLLLRSYDPQRGTVLVDRNDLRDVTHESLLDQIAVVPQEVDLFSRTIFNNVAYGKLDVTPEQVIEAAKTALAHDFIMRTENGYDTLVGERGIKLSGGERQRIGIARAVLRDPKILILDEATSHLDTESERLIAKATNSLIKDRTTIIIAHRLSTILHADMILVFEKGEIEAIGTHKELLEKSATYRKLYTLQFRDT